MKKLIMEFAFSVTRLVILNKKLLLSRLLDGILYELDMQDPQERDY